MEEFNAADKSKPALLVVAFVRGLMSSFPSSHCISMSTVKYLLPTNTNKLVELNSIINNQRQYNYKQNYMYKPMIMVKIRFFLIFITYYFIVL